MNTCPGCGSKLSSPDETCAECGSQASRAARLIGTTLADKYLIEEHLGSGGMCNVYSASHTGMGKQFAVKVLRHELAADPKVAERFEQEARAASSIHHPHAINVVDYGHDESGQPFIVMDLVKGETLGELLRNSGPLTTERTANILRQACGALEAAHKVGVIHRDIKPDNIIIARYDGSDWVQVVDFGVAKILEDVRGRASLTGANIIVGTPRYMSPEQCEEKPVDARSDIYSLGVVLYEMLSGEAPFEGSSSTRLLVAHASEPPPPLREKRPDLPAEVEAVVMSALDKDPAQRPQSAAELTRMFETAAGFGKAARVATGRGGAFSRISVPIGEDTLEDEATVIRKRPRTPVPSANTPKEVQALAEQDPNAAAIDRNPTPVEMIQSAVYPPARVYVRSSDYHRRANAWAWALGVIAMLVVAGLAGYIAFGDKLFGASSPEESLFDAQQAITEALARVDSLPKDHPLRSYLPQLSQWQGELRAYQEVKDYNPQVIERAERYRQKAEDISAQARAAAQAGRESPPAGNLNVNPSSPARDGSGEVKPVPPEKSEGKEEEEEEEEEEKNPPPEKEEKKGQQNSNNSNSAKPRKADPPMMDPVKPTPEKPANSNKPKNQSPPTPQRVKPDGNSNLSYITRIKTI
jgi:eukaryotic-like serine/threonine-protein kinase